MIEQTEKIGIFCAHMVDFCRPGHICHYECRVVFLEFTTKLVGYMHIWLHVALVCRKITSQNTLLRNQVYKYPGIHECAVQFND